MYWVHILLGMQCIMGSDSDCDSDCDTHNIPNTPVFSLSNLIPGLLSHNPIPKTLDETHDPIPMTRDEYYESHYDHITHIMQPTALPIPPVKQPYCTIPHIQLLNLTNIGNKQTRLVYWASSVYVSGYIYVWCVCMYVCMHACICVYVYVYILSYILYNFICIL